MRDPRGNYIDTKPILDNGPEWAAGCDRCEYGVVSAPPLTGACSLSLERLCQHVANEITFCDCMAGSRYRVNLQNHRQRLIEEARKDHRMEEQARRLSHPDIETARTKIQQIYAAMPTPTVHMEPAL